MSTTYHPRGKFLISKLSPYCFPTKAYLHDPEAAHLNDSEDETEVKENKKGNTKTQKKLQKSTKNDYDYASLNSNYRRFSSESDSSDVGKVRKCQALYVSLV